MVSIDRAKQCIGRRVVHEHKAVRGVVDHVTEYDVWVKTTEGDVIPCIPAHLSWVSTLSDSLALGIKYRMDQFDNSQVRGTGDFYTDDPDNEYLPGLYVIYSPALTNDDDENHPLYVVAHHIRRVYPLRINADPDLAWEIEEVLGWATA
jgi:hypothetical protein